MTPSTIPAERVGAKTEKKPEEVHINIGQSPASYKKCRVQSKLKVSMRNVNALWRAGPFEVDRWRQKHELNIKGSIKMLDSQSLGGCKGGINQFLCQAGGATPAVLVVSRQQASFKKVFTLSKETFLPDAKRSEMYADYRFNIQWVHLHCVMKRWWREMHEIWNQKWGRLSRQYHYNSAGKVTWHIKALDYYHPWTMIWIINCKSFNGCCSVSKPSNRQNNNDVDKQVDRKTYRDNVGPVKQ